ncbi:MAG: bifunctional metallophosphatase/5'-nucleotidase [Deltaproteobacteria bacterium]|nr:bifunctional metallophosphatase/5'-nucleotidase [Deltaproteobacteria bacterium]
MIKRCFFMFSVLIFVCLLPAVIYAGDSAGQAQVGAGLTKHLAIITTADLQSSICGREISKDEGGAATAQTVGGMDRIAALALQIRSQVDGALLVSTGDDLMGTFYSIFAGTPEIISMNMAGYDVVAPGNHEFDQGLSVYAEAAAKARFDLLTANVDYGDSPLAKIVKPYVFKNVAGIKVGLFGLMTPALQVVSNVGDEVTVDPDLERVATAMVKLLRGQGARLVIALSHCGSVLDRQLAAQVAGIDLIVGGHSHECLFESVANPEGKPCVIVQAGAGGSRVGVLRFSFSDTLQNPQWELVALNEKVASVAAVKNYVDGYAEKLDLLLGDPIGETLVALDSRKIVVRQSESNLGNLIADSVVNWFTQKNSDLVLGLFNGGSIRGDRLYPAGKLSHKDVLNMLPFGDTIVRVAMTGSQLLAVLEVSASALLFEGAACPASEQADAGGFLQLSRALKVVIDPSQPPFCARYKGREVEEIINPGHRIVKVETLHNGRWQALVPEAVYTVYVNSWLAGAGDGHYIFNGLKKEDTTVLAADVLARYIEKKTPVRPVVDGRIIIEGFKGQTPKIGDTD